MTTLRGQSPLREPKPREKPSSRKSPARAQAKAERQVDRELLAWGLGSGIVLFLALLGWLDYHGYFISPDAIYINILAKSFWAHPYVIWFKRAYSYPYEIIHHDFTFPPLIPLVHWCLGKIGVTSWHRGNWMTAFFIGMTVPAWIWAIEPHFERKKPRPPIWRNPAFLAGWIATLLLLAQAQNQMWHELYLGIVSPIAVFLYILSYGAYMRGRYKTCGVLTGLAFMVRFDAQVTLAILVIGHILSRLELKRLRKFDYEFWKKLARECFAMGIPFFIVTSPWWIRAMMLGKPPWFNHMVPIFLYGEAGNFRWFADTDTALGHPIWGATPYIFYEELIRQRWTDLVIAYVGPFASEMALMGPIFFLGFIYAIRRPMQRPLMAFLALGAIIRTMVIAGLVDSFNRRYFLILDAGILTWYALMVFDPNRWIRWIAIGLCALLVQANWGDFTNVIHTMRPYVGYLEGGSPGVSAAVAELDKTRAPVLAAQIEGHAIAYYTDQIPVIELPTNFKDAGMMDEYLDRWKIGWTTVAGAIKPYVKKHEFITHKASDGYEVSEVRPLPPAPASSQAPAPAPAVGKH